MWDDESQAEAWKLDLSWNFATRLYFLQFWNSNKIFWDTTRMKFHKEKKSHSFLVLYCRKRKAARAPQCSFGNLICIYNAHLRDVMLRASHLFWVFARVWMSKRLNDSVFIIRWPWIRKLFVAKISATNTLDNYQEKMLHS